jgi:predicted phosphohydrolase
MTTKNEFQTNFPFMTCIRSNDLEYIGILINYDTNVTSLYDFAIIRTEPEKKLFLESGETWWWESNRKIPINIFLKQDMIMFRNYIKTFNSKDIEIVFGPIVNLSEIAEKRIKRKSIQLVRSTTKKIRN